MPKFIVFSGRKQAGKTTAANYIKEYLQNKNPNLSIITTSFAEPIKTFCRNIIGLTDKQVYGSEQDKNSETHIMWDYMPDEIRLRYGNGTDKTSRRAGPMTAREVMQIFGTDIFRNFFDYDIWAKAPFNTNWIGVDIVIIDDCRFPNEADIALKNNACLIRLTRNPLKDTHISEVAMDDFDSSRYTHIIDNRGFTVDQLAFELRNILSIEGLSR